MVASGRGGGLYLTDDLFVDWIAVTGNSAPIGGGIYCSGPGDIDRFEWSVVTNNTPDDQYNCLESGAECIPGEVQECELPVVADTSRWHPIVRLHRHPSRMALRLRGSSSHSTKMSKPTRR